MYKIVLSIITGGGNEKPDYTGSKRVFMSEKELKNVGQIIKGMNNRLSSLAKKSDHLKTLNNNLNKHLPSQLKSNISAYDFYQGILKVTVPNASVATQLRNSAISLMKKLNQELDLIGREVISIQCRIKTQRTLIQNLKQESMAVTITDDSRKKIKTLSSEIKYQKLADALDKLSRNNLN